MQKPPDINEKGFTLVELAIALVVIGLITGGILVGQSLIKTATVKRQLFFVISDN